MAPQKEMQVFSSLHNLLRCSVLDKVDPVLTQKGLLWG